MLYFGDKRRLSRACEFVQSRSGKWNKQTDAESLSVRCTAGLSHDIKGTLLKEKDEHCYPAQCFDRIRRR